MATIPRADARQAADRRVLVPVPWEKALTIRERLLEWGIHTIARFDPRDRKAELEILHGTDPRRAKELLKGLTK